MNMPDGFEHQPGLISEEEEKRLVAEASQLPFKPFEFRGYVGNRRVVGCGLLESLLVAHIADVNTKTRKPHQQQAQS